MWPDLAIFESSLEQNISYKIAQMFSNIFVCC